MQWLTPRKLALTQMRYTAIALSVVLSQAPLCVAGGVTQKARAAEPTAGAGQGAIHLKVRLTTVDGKIITAMLNDSATAQDFAALLPLTLSLDDYAATEKIAYLPRRLSTAGVPDGFTPSVGDITYYAPWGNLAIFHKDFRYSEKLVSLGQIDSGMESLRRGGVLKVTIERIEK
ncbi:cyclophilin-like fold protein [Ralstonia nicotianae]|nr:hypothetical protein [Ralstonia solanacearum]